MRSSSTSHPPETSSSKAFVRTFVRSFAQTDQYLHALSLSLLEHITSEYDILVKYLRLTCSSSCGERTRATIEETKYVFIGGYFVFSMTEGGGLLSPKFVKTTPFFFLRARFFCRVPRGRGRGMFSIRYHHLEQFYFSANLFSFLVEKVS